MAARHPALVLAAAAAVLVAPSLILGTLASQSAPQNLGWAAQFSEQFRAGILYPRWMPDSFGGLGSPAFYFYPPLPFWLDSLVSLVFNGLSTAHRLSLDWLLLFWASGLAMRAWLVAETGRPGVALWGALAYMAAPYHLFVDHYMRGAFAEATAYVFLPLVMLGIRRATERRPGVVLLALAYGGLLLSHLPTALLVSVTLLPAYAIFRVRASPRLALGPIAGGCLGAGLAALYLLPALRLQGWISADLFWTRFYHVDNWLLLAPARWPEPVIMQTIASIALAALALAVVVCVTSWKSVEARFWAIAALVCIALLAGVVPWFWQLPEIAKVQFPWRLMLAVEFALITAVSVAPAHRLVRREIYAYAVCAVLVAPAVSFGIAAAVAAVEAALSGHAEQARDVKEYEPHGFPVAPELGYAELGLEALRDTPPVDCAPAARLCQATAERFGGLRIEVDGSVPTTVTVRRFYFPAWTVDGAMTLAPSEKYRLASFVAPAGRAVVQLSRVLLPVERWGLAISGAALLLLAAAAAITARNNSRAGR